MALDYRNNVIVDLNAAVGAGIASISISVAQQALIPNGAQNTIGTLEEVDATTGAITLREGILITNRAGNILTVTRAYQQMPLSDTGVVHQQVSFAFDPVNGARIGLYWTEEHGERIDLQLDPGVSSGLVHKTTAETIDDLKTFTTLPQQDAYVAPTINEEFAPKKYVDDQILISIPVDTLFGDGSDGSLAIAAGTTTLPVTNNILIKQYENVDITGGILDFSGGDDDGNVMVIKVRDTFTMSAGLIDASLMGGIGGLGPEFTAGGAVVAGSGNSISIKKPVEANNAATTVGVGINAGGLGGEGVQAIYTFGNNSMSVYAGGGGGYGGPGAGAAFNTGGDGGIGGGGLIILAKTFNFTGGTIRSNGQDGLVGITTFAAGAGGGGGGAAGTIGVLTDTLVSNTGTIELIGGDGAAGNDSLPAGPNISGGGGGAGGEGETGGGSGGQGEDSVDGIAGGTATNSINGVGGTGGVGGIASIVAFSDTGGGGGGGGGGAGEFYIEVV